MKYVLNQQYLIHKYFGKSFASYQSQFLLCFLINPLSSSDGIHAAHLALGQPSLRVRSSFKNGISEVPVSSKSFIENGVVMRLLLLFRFVIVFSSFLVIFLLISCVCYHRSFAFFMVLVISPDKLERGNKYRDKERIQRRKWFRKKQGRLR